MARKKERLEWGGYLNVRLSQQQLKEFLTWYGEFSDDVWELFVRALMEGMKLSVVYDSEIDTYTASIMNSPRCLCGVSLLYSLSAYSQNWQEAIALVLYKHYIVLGGTWENYRPSRPYQDRLG